jgi:hypothetical protein
VVVPEEIAMDATKRQERSLPLFRTIRAHMVERYIFNYRMPPDELRKRLPAPWLEPLVVNGYSAVSFCILWLERLTVAPIPALFRFSTISCAYRIGVLDTSGPAAEPSVYVTDRWADLPLIAKLGPFVLQDTIPVVKAAIGHDNAGGTHVQMSYTDGSGLFSASVRPTADGQMGSSVFGSVQDFAAFIKGGVTSYGPSLTPGMLTKVDLYKEDVTYEPLDAHVEFSELFDETWADAGMEFDSAVRAKGAEYVWAYRGLWSTVGRGGRA